MLLTLHITRRWRKDLVVQVEIPLDDASSIQAQLDRHLSGGWQRAQGQRPDSWARSHAEQTARYRGEI